MWWGCIAPAFLSSYSTISQDCQKTKTISLHLGIYEAYQWKCEEQLQGTPNDHTDTRRKHLNPHTLHPIAA